MGTIRDAKSEAAIIDQIEAVIRDLDPTIDLTSGTPIKDVSVDAVASVTRLQFVLLDLVSSSSSLDQLLAILADAAYLADLAEALPGLTETQITDFISGMIDGTAAAYGITRVPASAAQYRQRFYRTDDNGGAAITIPVGTQVQNDDGSVKATVMASVAQVPRYDATQGLYYVEETVQVTTGGTVGNVSLGSLRRFVAAIPATVTTTSNVSLLVTGADEESDPNLVERMKLSFQGRNLNTDAGYVSRLKASPLGFTDTIVVGPGDDLMVRQVAGAIDIYCVGGLAAQTSEQQQYSDLVTEYLISTQPVLAVDSVVGDISGTHPATDWEFAEDTGAFAGSARARNGITILRPSAFVNGEVLTLTFTYDSLILAAQNQLRSEDDDVPDADELVKIATQVGIDLTVQAVMDGSVAEATAKLNLSSDFAKFLGGGTSTRGAQYPAFALDRDVDMSDLLGAISAVLGIDRIDLDTFKIYTVRDGVRTLATSDPVAIAKNEYARAGTVTFI